MTHTVLYVKLRQFTNAKPANPAKTANPPALLRFPRSAADRPSQPFHGGDGLRSAVQPLEGGSHRQQVAMGVYKAGKKGHPLAIYGAGTRSGERRHIGPPSGGDNLAPADRHGFRPRLVRLQGQDPGVQQQKVRRPGGGRPFCEVMGRTGHEARAHEQRPAGANESIPGLDLVPSS